MKREGYVFALAIFGILVYQNRKIHHMSELLETVGLGMIRLLDESYQADVDGEFEDIVEHSLDDLDD